MKRRRYYIAFVNIFEGNVRTSSRELYWDGDFIFEEVHEFLDKKNDCINSTIIFFKELKKYEYFAKDEEPSPLANSEEKK